MSILNSKMVSSNSRFNFKVKEGGCILENDGPLHKSKTKPYILVILFLVIILICSFLMSVYAFLKIRTFKEEVATLRQEVNRLKLDWIDDNLFEDIRQFANEDIYSDDITEGKSEKGFNDEDSFNLDYDLNYEEEDNRSIKKLSHSAVGEAIDEFSPDEKDTTSLLNGGSFTKLGKETIRRKRNVKTTFFDDPINQTEKNDQSFRLNILKLHKRFGTIEEGSVNSQTQILGSKDGSLPSSSEHPLTGSVTQLTLLGLEPKIKETDEKLLKRFTRKSEIKSEDHLWESVTEEQTSKPIAEDEPYHRRNRHRIKNNLESLDVPRPGRARALPAIQFGGDTSRYVLGQHSNFNGDGHLRHPDQTFVDWKANDWVKSVGMDQYFHMKDGHLKIQESGLYFIYAQIYYLDEHDTNGFRVYKNQHTLLQCTTMTHSTERFFKGNTCYTGGIDYLVEGDQISVRDLSDGRYSLFETGKSFFGIFKLGEVRIK